MSIHNFPKRKELRESIKFILQSGAGPEEVIEVCQEVLRSIPSEVEYLKIEPNYMLWLERAMHTYCSSGPYKGMKLMKEEK